ncbi:MAG: asparaginase, partial [Ornithinimicrobium sp.]
MSSYSALGEAPVVATVTRSGLVESVHHGIVVATDADGSVVFGHGAHDIPIYPRSSNKPLQAVAMLRSGAVIEGELLALASASHNGEDFHLDGVRRILALADEGLTEADLQNTPDYPYDDAVKHRWIAAGHGAESIAQNCSGKHAAMLVTCVAAGWEMSTYLHPDHRLQRAMTTAIEDLSGERVAATGVDGCGAPVMAISLAGLARAFGSMAAAPAFTPAGRVASAMSAHPRFVGGTGRDVSALMEAVPGLVAKDGAEAVYAVGLPDGRGVAVKITDGSARVRAAVVLKALQALGVHGDGDAFAEIADSPV